MKIEHHVYPNYTSSNKGNTSSKPSEQRLPKSAQHSKCEVHQGINLNSNYETDIQTESIFRRSNHGGRELTRELSREGVKHTLQLSRKPLSSWIELRGSFSLEFNPAEEESERRKSRTVSLAKKESRNFRGRFSFALRCSFVVIFFKSPPPFPFLSHFSTTFH